MNKQNTAFGVTGIILLIIAILINNYTMIMLSITSFLTVVLGIAEKNTAKNMFTNEHPLIQSLIIMTIITLIYETADPNVENASAVCIILLFISWLVEWFLKSE